MRNLAIVMEKYETPEMGVVMSVMLFRGCY